MEEMTTAKLIAEIFLVLSNAMAGEQADFDLARLHLASVSAALSSAERERDKCRTALEQISAHGMNGSAWCVAVADEGGRMKVVINKCFGGFGLSDAAYEKLIEWGVPVRKYIEQERDPETRLFLPQPANDGEVIFDRELTPPEADSFSELYWRYKGTGANSRYWDCWTRETRTHPLVIRLVEEMGAAANGRCADLKVVEIPDGTEYEISEYDGLEHIAEVHQTWR